MFESTFALSDASRILAGIVLLTVVTIEFGGLFLVKVAGGKVPLTEFQKAFSRAGHAHAGVLVILGLVGLVLADATGLDGFWGWVARAAIPLAAILMSGGFFAAMAGRGRTEPNKAVVILFAGAASLAVGVLTLGIGLLAA
ncbi:hypothetical protein K3N28_07745 [Glycomyces sp. TRM65418]|uniref:hypothetical protein n=1 Tax=Glycomyces sp. TRM65418 TaxID=2867006 RepID=UPI001CE6B604|nr:hypothetical protein [Glycomyces sp. TRM65418]MCC3762964.1 hypothetical protein [Glycomyces sp. TRM65418]QZD56984.1 hypothetical protein K3N28_07695 [Glycomyces sp. TRM65418]